MLQASTGVLSGSIVEQLPRGLISGSSQIDLEVVTGGSGIITSSNTEIPEGTISSSAQITAFGFVSESGDNIPEGTISSSAQITSLGFISESFSTDGTDIVSGAVLRTLDGTDVISGSLVGGIFYLLLLNRM